MVARAHREMVSPYRIAPAAAAPTPKRSAVVRLWHAGLRKPSLRLSLCVALAGCLLCAVAFPATRSMGYLGAPIGFVCSCLAILLRGYLRLRRVRAALAPCPTHRALGKHGRCGHYACCYACFRKDYDDVAALGERARYASGATAAVAEARDRRKRIR